ncbi:hypothetical protein P4O66_014229 [Electrophorus voltai]|uniref:Uncharacterized protein n=1 Tax=Electrophorus voltai TaxID=2609070 RepID=A0AAD8Z0T9_9TELE|nr:hypothetical protein P4O66_014229 [Electrophorus voltai]
MCSNNVGMSSRGHPIHSSNDTMEDTGRCWLSAGLIVIKNVKPLEKDQTVSARGSTTGSCVTPDESFNIFMSAVTLLCVTVPLPGCSDRFEGCAMTDYLTTLFFTALVLSLPSCCGITQMVHTSLPWQRPAVQGPDVTRACPGSSGACARLPNAQSCMTASSLPRSLSAVSHRLKSDIRGHESPRCSFIHPFLFHDVFTPASVNPVSKQTTVKTIAHTNTSAPIHTAFLSSFIFSVAHVSPSCCRMVKLLLTTALLRPMTAQCLQLLPVRTVAVRSAAFDLVWFLIN